MNQSQDLRRTTNPSLRPQKVLVVDDDAVIRDMMVDILECEGYLPELAANGQEALEILQKSADSYLVFLDLMMPTFSGKEVCLALTANPRVRQFHILVLMSAMDNIAETYSLDVDMVMSKPFVVDDVARVLDTYLR